MAPKFLLTIALIVGGISWLAIAGFQSGDSYSYYVTVDEFFTKQQELAGKKLKVAGLVEEGSIKSDAKPIRFQLTRYDSRMPVQYVGTDPLPDMFADNIEAVVIGYYKDGSFHADQVQAKCASKYEAEYSEESEGTGESSPVSDKPQAAPNPA